MAESLSELNCMSYSLFCIDRAPYGSYGCHNSYVLCRIALVVKGYIVEKHDTSGTLIEEHTYDSGYNLILIKRKLATDSSWTSIYENTHDNKNMPFKNVDSWYPLSGYRYVSPNNTTSITNILPVGNNMSMDISYGINDFPTYIETTYSDGRSKSETLEYNN